jgi:hypothetical protein
MRKIETTRQVQWFEATPRRLSMKVLAEGLARTNLTSCGIEFTVMTLYKVYRPMVESQLFAGTTVPRGSCGEAGKSCGSERGGGP